MKKYIILSFDDNTIEDRKAVELLNKYGLHGTFHVNSGTLGTNNHIGFSELKTLYKNHEISSHTANHPNLPDLRRDEMLREIKEDIESLSKHSGRRVRSMSYPFGNYNQTVLDCLEELGVACARTVNDTFRFHNPEDFRVWNPTCHFNKAIELNLLSKLIEDDDARLFFVWTHSWEFSDDKSWRIFEDFLQRISQNDDIVSMTCIDYYLQEKGNI